MLFVFQLMRLMVSQGLVVANNILSTKGVTIPGVAFLRDFQLTESVFSYHPRTIAFSTQFELPRH